MILILRQLFCCSLLALSAPTVQAQVMQYKPLSIEVGAKDKLMITGFRGRVQYKAANSGQVITVQLKQTNPTQIPADIKESLDEWLFSMQKTEGVVQINVRSPQSKKTWTKLLTDKNWQPSFELLIQGPSLPTTISWRDGDIVLDGLRHPAHVQAQNGKIIVTNQKAAVDISHNSGEVALQSIDGDVEVETFAGKVIVAQVKGRVIVHNFNGATQLSGVAGQVEISSFDGLIQVDKSQGRLEFKTEKGAVRSAQFEGDIRGTTNQGAVTLATMGRSSVNINSKEGNISLQMADSGASVNISTKDGALTLPDFLQVSRQPQLRMARGRLRGKQPGQVFVRTETGGVRLR
jgi:DUF4097 and DUF4098 domain-containing protein YvlB